MPVLAEDDVIRNLDLEQLTSAHQITRDFDVRLTRRRVPARMLVLCDAPVYVQLAIGGVGDNQGAMGKGVLCLTEDHSSNPSRNRVFAD